MSRQIVKIILAPSTASLTLPLAAAVKVPALHKPQSQLASPALRWIAGMRETLGFHSRGNAFSCSGSLDPSRSLDCVLNESFRFSHGPSPFLWKICLSHRDADRQSGDHLDGSFTV